MGTWLQDRGIDHDNERSGCVHEIEELRVLDPVGAAAQRKLDVEIDLLVRWSVLGVEKDWFDLNNAMMPSFP
jgi:hypothetical protein